MSRWSVICFVVRDTDPAIQLLKKRQLSNTTRLFTASELFIIELNNLEFRLCRVTTESGGPNAETGLHVQRRNPRLEVFRWCCVNTDRCDIVVRIFLSFDHIHCSSSMSHHHTRPGLMADITNRDATLMYNSDDTNLCHFHKSMMHSWLSVITSDCRCCDSTKLIITILPIHRHPVTTHG